MANRRDFRGYGETPPTFRWPGGKTLALSLVFNFEEGAEHSVTEDGIIETIGEFAPVDVQTRDMGMESVYEYGQRAGIWRILNFLREEKVKATFFAAARALEANPDATKRIVADGHEICDHGLRWTELFRMTREQETGEIAASIELIEKMTGRKPSGFYAREPSANTLDILSGFGNFVYDSDSYADDLPYYCSETGMLIVPYTPDANDFHFLSPMHRFATGREFCEYLKETFDVLYRESSEQSKLMTAAFHVRITGRPGRFNALREFVAYAKHRQRTWIATREEIARFWLSEFPRDSNHAHSPADFGKLK